MGAGRMARAGWYDFIETHHFAAAWDALGLTDADKHDLQLMIAAGPGRYPVIPGTDGLRKVRFADRRAGRGKSGAYRVCYAAFVGHGLVYLIMVFDKSEKADLTAADRAAVREFLRRTRERLEGRGEP